MKEGKMNIFKRRLFNFRLHNHIYKLIQFKYHHGLSHRPENIY